MQKINSYCGAFFIKKSMLVVMVVMLLALFPISGNAQVVSDVLTFVLSNEALGNLIDKIIHDGYGNGSLYEALVAIEPASGGVITDAFLDTLGNCPAGREIFTAPLSNYTGVNNPVCINADCTIRVQPVFGRDYYGHTGYATHPPCQTVVGRETFTDATSPQYHINAGGTPAVNYKAFAIAWGGTEAPPAPPPCPHLERMGNDPAVPGDGRRRAVLYEKTAAGCGLKQ